MQPLIGITLLILSALSLPAEQATVTAISSTKNLLYIDDTPISGNDLIDKPIPVYLYRQIITITTDKVHITAKTTRNRAWTPDVGDTLEFTAKKLRPGATLKVTKPNGKIAKWRIIELRAR
jgi:hypothetical protein